MEQQPLKKTGAATRRGAKALDRNEVLIEVIRRLREKLPGDPRFGDPLSTADRRYLAIAEQRLAELTTAEAGVLRALGLGALQIWQAVLESRGRGQGEA